MKNAMKPFIVSVLALCVFTATVLCCCTGAAVMAHLNKVAACSHCPVQASSQGHTSHPDAACQYQLTQGEFQIAQVTATVMPAHFTGPVVDRHVLPRTIPYLLPDLRGSPPLIVSATPIYIQIRSLRI